MGFYQIPGFGIVHLNEGKKPRIVPGNERHKWDKKPKWGESTTCLKCGCVKSLLKPDYRESYQMPGQSETSERPPCQQNK